MASAALAQLTQLLDSKQLAGTLTRPLEQGRPCTPSGVDRLDDHLVGGWPQGHLSDVVGPASSGRTAVMLATFANDGLRAYYFSFAVVLWFASPLALAVGAAGIVYMLYRREFRSEVLEVLRS